MATMKSQVKYISQNGDSGKLTPVYHETTIPSRMRSKVCTDRLFSRLGVLTAILALIASAAILVILFSGGYGRGAEVEELQRKLEAQQTRLHRMNKELQFLMARQQAYEAREESEKRRIQFMNSDLSGAQFGDDVKISSSDELPSDDDIDVSKLPQASPNKRRGKGARPTEN